MQNPHRTPVPPPPATPDVSPALQAYLDRLISPARRQFALALITGENQPETTLTAEDTAKVRARVSKYLNPAEPRRPKTVVPAAVPSCGARFRKMAFGMNSALEQLSQVPFEGMNTTRRRAEFQQSRAEDRLRATELQRLLLRLAEAADSGTLEPVLSGIVSRSVVESLLGTLRREESAPGQSISAARLPLPYLYAWQLNELRPLLTAMGDEGKAALDVLSRCGGHDAPISAEDTVTLQAAVTTLTRGTAGAAARKKLGSSLQGMLRDSRAFLLSGLTDDAQVQQAALALRPYRQEWLSAAELQAERVRKLEHALIGANFDGYFPTPAPLAQVLIEQAELQPGMTVLEPSAGRGDLADLARAEGAQVSVIEPVSRLRELLEFKGYALVGSDALKHHGEYDRVIMNPPFERRQDARHVRHAFTLLKPGGRLVAVVSEGLFNGHDPEAVDFRAFLETHGAEVTRNPTGAFSVSAAGRSTSVSTRTLTLDRN